MHARLTTLLLVLGLVLVGGCGGDDDKKDAPAPAATSAAASAPAAGASEPAAETASGAATEPASAPAAEGDAAAILAGITSAPTGPSAVTAKLAVAIAGQPEDPTAAFLASGPIEITLDGTSGGADGTLQASLALKAGPLAIPVDLLSDGTTSWVRYAGQWYVLDPATAGDGTAGQAAALASDLDPARLTAAVGDPNSWLESPTVVGDDSVEGVATTHVTAGLDVVRLAESLTSVAAAAQSSGSVPGGEALSAVDRQSIEDAVKAAKVDVWVGKDDGVLRRLALDLDLDLAAASGATGGTGAGVDGAKVTLDFTTVPSDAPTIEAPTDARPIAELGGALQSGLGGALGAG